MKNSVFILISLFFLIGCGEEDREIYPDGMEMLPGVYDSFDEGDGITTAIVKHIDKDTYTIQFNNSPNTATWELEITEIIANKFVYYNILNKAWSACDGTSNMFIIYNNSVSHITLTLCIYELLPFMEGNIKATLKFEGTKTL